MCGILGTVNLSFDERTLDLVRHRGPDDYGVTRLSLNGHDLTLGHRRLSIVDLSPAGHQPMATVDGKGWLVFNGEIYNHADIRATLRQREFLGHSDTETALYSLREKGIDAVKAFNGIFGFCYVDIAMGRMYLARDPFGVKPVYYRQDGEKFCFSSEIRPIRALMPDEISTENLAELARLRYLPSPDTMYRNIRKLSPGHYLEISLGANTLVVRETPYLEPLPAERRMGFSDALARYGELFAAAVRRQMMGDVEVGVLLSGGVDSALVSAEAQRYSGRPLKAFTVGFAERALEDEISDAAETAKYLGMEHHVVNISNDQFFGALERCVRVVEEPLATTSLIPMYFLSELAASKVKVVLTGQGADEPLGGYGRYRCELLSPLTPSFVAGLADLVARGFGIKNQVLRRGAWALAERDDARRFLRAYEVFSNAEIQRLLGVADTRSEARIRRFYELLGCAAKKRSVERMMGIDVRMNLADDLLLYTDKITMCHSLECRVPILDLELVRFIESLPAAYRTRLGRGKIIHKAYAERSLPAEIVHRPKKGFLSPTRKWFRDVEALRGSLLDPNSAFASVFNVREVSAVIDQHSRGYNRERHLFMLLCLKYLMDNQ